MIFLQGLRSPSGRAIRANKRTARGSAAPIEQLESRLFLSVAKPDHIVIVVEQDRTSDAIGNAIWSYLNSVAGSGLVFTNSHGVTHPSTPNSLAMYSGSTQGISGNGRDHSFSAPNLAKSLFDAGLSFSGFVESLPEDGSQVTQAGNTTHADLYTRNINPMAMFTDIGIDPVTGQPRANSVVNRTFGAFSSIPTNDYSSLPTVSFIIPNNLNNSHGSNVAEPWAGSPDEENNDILRDSADDWLRANLDGYLNWAKDNNSLLIITQDEERWTGGTASTITTVVNGDPDLFEPGTNSDNINHYNLLRTITDMYGVAPLGVTGNVAALDRDAAGQLMPDMVPPTTTLLTTQRNTVALGTEVVFTATVSQNTNGAKPNGTVSFYKGETLLGTAELNTQGVATFATSSLPAGGNSIVAKYNGAHGYPASTSTTYPLFVVAPPVVDAGGPYTVIEGQIVFLNAQVFGSAATTFEWDFDYDGVTFTPSAASNMVALSTDDGPFTRTVAVRASGMFGSSIDTAELTVTNAAPTATLRPGSPVVLGTASAVLLDNATDVSPVDRNAGLLFSFDFNNDGDFEDAGDIYRSTDPVGLHTFSAAGTFNVRGRVEDKDGGFTDYTTNVTVNPVTPPTPINVTIQAENATRSSGAVIGTGNKGYTGTGYVNLGSTGNAIQFQVITTAAGTHDVSIRYAIGGSTARPFAIEVNGSSILTFAGAPTGSWTTWNELQIPVALTAGTNTIRLVSASTAGANIDVINVKSQGPVTPPPATPITLQAEAATRSSGAKVGTANKGYTGSGYVNLGPSGNYVRFTTDATPEGSRTLKVRYANGGTTNRPMNLVINGVPITSNQMASTGSWTTWNELTFTVDFAAGVNTIELISATASGANIDSITISGADGTTPPPTAPVTVQVETGTRSSAAAVGTQHRGYTGAGYVNLGTNGNYIEITTTRTTAGPTTIKLRYANGSTTNRPINISVNGTTVASNVALAATGSWTAWAEVTVTLDLLAGNNVIRLTTIGASGANVDAMTIG